MKVSFRKKLSCDQNGKVKVFTYLNRIYVVTPVHLIQVLTLVPLNEPTLPHSY